MRFNREIFALLFLLLVFVGGGLLLTGRDESKSRQVGKEKTPDPSVYNDRASGSRGCFEWVGKLGYRPQVWRQDWGRSGHAAAVLFVIDPQADSERGALTGGGEDRTTRPRQNDPVAGATRRRCWPGCAPGIRPC